MARGGGGYCFLSITKIPWHTMAGKRVSNWRVAAETHLIYPSGGIWGGCSCSLVLSSWKENSSHFFLTLHKGPDSEAFQVKLQTQSNRSIVKWSDDLRQLTCGWVKLDTWFSSRASHLLFHCHSILLMWIYLRQLVQGVYVGFCSCMTFFKFPCWGDQFFTEAPFGDGSPPPACWLTPAPEKRKTVFLFYITKKKLILKESNTSC